MANENYILLEKRLAIHYLNECSGSFCFHLSCNGGICLILGERQRAETVENLHKIFVDKISQKKYNEIECKRQILMRLDTKLPQPFASWSNSL